MAGKQEDASTTNAASVPQYVLDHAPLLHLYTKDPYRPSSLSSQLANTTPKVNFQPVSLPSTAVPLSLDNLDQLNALGGKSVYLTSTTDITTGPKWLEGLAPDAQGVIRDAVTSVIVVVEKQDQGVVDAFYFYFYAFNWGGVVLGKQLGDHVGDWEHNMIRFRNGVPETVWLSQHANGEAYTFSSVQKDGSGKRPIFYSANGSHAIYPTPGLHDHTIPNLNLDTPLLLVDETDAGPLYDVLTSAYFYKYIPAGGGVGGGFTAMQPTGNAPTGFLNFIGQWGDQEYPADDARQKGKNLFSFKKYVSGPTGPADKQLNRKEVWPESQFSSGQRVRTKLGVSFWEKAKKDFAQLNCLGKKKAKVTKVKVSGEVVE